VFLVLVVMVAVNDAVAHIRLSSLATMDLTPKARDHDCDGAHDHHRDRVKLSHLCKFGNLICRCSNGSQRFVGL
jgi:hypothetical protein